MRVFLDIKFLSNRQKSIKIKDIGAQFGAQIINKA
jgi:hypothetical protein